MLALVVLMVVRACAGEVTSCSGDAAVETSSCGTAPAPSLLQTVVDQPRRGRRRRARESGTPASAPDSTPTPPADSAPDSTPTPPADSNPVSTPTSQVGNLDCPLEGNMHRRKRKNIFDMDVALWDKLKTAWRALQASGDYDVGWSVEHGLHYGPPMPDHNNGALGFFPFHRGSIQDLESRLMELAENCDVTFPYWDESAIDTKDLSTRDWRNSKLFTDTYMGTLDDEKCVKDGLPGGWKYPFDNPEDTFIIEKRNGKKETHPTCVSRDLSEDGGWPSMIDTAILVQGLPDFEHFTHVAELFHGNGHGNIGGNMLSKVGRASPSDPVFYLHHTFYDSLYYRWQKFNVGTDNVATLVKDREDLVPFANPYDEGEGCVKLPYSTTRADDGDVTCVSYELTAFPEASSCGRLQQQIQAGSCSLDELVTDKSCVDDQICTASLEGSMERNSNSFGEVDESHEIHSFFVKYGAECGHSKTTTEADDWELKACLVCDSLCTDR